MISFDRNLQELKSIKLSVRPIGNTPISTVSRMSNVFKQLPRTILFSNFYQGYLYKNTMGVFPNKDWSSEGVNVDVLNNDTQLEWPELLMCLKPYLLFGVVDCALGEISSDELQKFRKKAQDDKLVRYLLLNCDSDTFQNKDNEQLFIIVPNLTDDKLIYYLEDQLQLYLCQVIEHFSYEILRLKNDQSNLIVFNMREDKINDPSKLKKRKQGRQYKVMGDFALMVSSYQDALDYYKTALDILTKSSDYLWIASTHQCLAAIKPSHDESEEHFREAIIALKKTKFTNLEIECFFKSMQFRRDISDKLGLDKTINIFLKTFDPESPIDKCKFYVFVSKLYGDIGMWRKQAYYMKLASNHISKINRPLSLELLKRVAKMYKLGSLFQDGDSVIFWQSLQQSLSQEIQQFLQDNKSHMQMEMVQMFKNEYSNQKLSQIFQTLQSDYTMAQLSNANLTMIPEIIKVTTTPFKGLFRKTKTTNVKSSDVFIVNPWALKEQSKNLEYPSGSILQFNVILNNQYNVDLLIDSMCIVYEGVECIAYPQSVTIPAETNKYSVVLNIKPLQMGILKIIGIKVQYLNYVYINTMDDYGNIQQVDRISEDSYNLKNIVIREELPNATAEIYRDHLLINEIDAVYFDPSELFTYQILIRNNGEKVVDNLEIELCIEAEDPPIYDFKQSVQHFSLDSFSTTSILLTDFKHEKCIQIPKIPHQTSQIKKISLSLYFQYEGQIYQKEIRLNRLVKMKAKTVIKQCLFVSKYFSYHNNVREIHDLQDNCYLSLHLEKQDLLVAFELKSQLLLQGQLKAVLNENTNNYQTAIKLRKMPFNELDNPDLSIVWVNLFNGTTGILKPFDSLSKEDVCKHCCNDLIEIQCKEINKVINYTIGINPNLSNSPYLQVHISLTQEVINLSCSRSRVSSVTNQSEQAVIVDGYTSYKLQLNKDEYTIKSGSITLMYNGTLPRASLKVQIVDQLKQIAYIKRAEII